MLQANQVVIHLAMRNSHEGCMHKSTCIASGGLHRPQTLAMIVPLRYLLGLGTTTDAVGVPNFIAANELLDISLFET